MDENEEELEEEIEFFDDETDDELVDDIIDETEEVVEPSSESFNYQISNQNIPDVNISNSSLSTNQSPNNKLDSSVSEISQNARIPEKLSTSSGKNSGMMSSPRNMPGNKMQKNASMGKLSGGNTLPSSDSNNQIVKKREQSQINSDIKSNNEQNSGSDKSLKMDNSKSSENNNKGNNQDLKSKVLSAKDDAQTAAKAAANIAAGNKVEGAIDIAKLAWKHKGKIIKKYLISFFAGFFVIILIFFMIMSPLIENIEKVKEFLGQAIEFGEKTSNLYSGLGFQTTDEAFYEELSDQFSNSNGEVDLPLVMSALMYTETTNDYSTDYSIDELDTDDESISSVLDGIVSDSTSEYTQGQILRARMLCKGMTEQTEGEKVTFDEFLNQYGKMLDINMKNMAQSFDLRALPGIYLDSVKNIINAVKGPTYATVTGEQVNALAELFETTTMGLKSITNISVGKVEVVDENGNTNNKYTVYVTMQVKKYSEDKFKSYLANYYIRKMPEFKPLIDGLSGTALDNEIDRIIKEIYDHRSWYVDIYGDVEASSEDYENACVGAISGELVPELTLPVKINSSSVTFSGEYAYGLTTAQIHNGVDLNSETTGTKEGDSVFAISIGEVVKVAKNNCNKESDNSCDSNGTYIKLKHSTMIDGTKYEFYSVYANLQAGSVTLKKGDKVKKGDVIGKAGKTGDATISQVHFEFHNEDDTPIDPTNLFIECTTGELVGDTNEEKIWFYFRNLGYSEVATAAAMGNLSVESGLESQRVQGTELGSQYSIDYTNDVDSGKISRNDFINNGPGGGGYGLAQWTSSGRKDNLYSYKKKENTSIGDLQMQLGYLMTEINGSEWTSSKYKNTWKNASSSSQLNDSTTAFCTGFERPGTPHLDERKQNAKDIYNRNKGKKAPSTSSVSSSGSNSIIASAKEIKKYIANNGYTYGALGVQVKNAKSSKKIDCSSYVSWVLYNAGYLDFGGYQQTDVTFYANSWGFKEVKKSDVKPGDILIYSGHVEIYAGMDGNTTKVYNAGSNNSIKNSGVTNSSRGINAATKILRPSK